MRPERSGTAAHVLGDASYGAAIYHTAADGTSVAPGGKEAFAIMTEALTSVRIHLLWSTHQRRPWLDPEWRPRLFAQASALAERRAARLVCAGGTRDHVHLYLDHPPSISLADLVQVIKAGTSRWIHSSFPHRREFKWQSGYAAFSVTPKEDAAMQAYIREQEVHHRDHAFYAEFVGLLEGHGVSYDIHRIMD